MENSPHYTQEEIDIINDLNAGKYTSLEGEELEEMKKILTQGAKNTLKHLYERKAISVRVFKSDIHKLKSIAYKEGIPLQRMNSLSNFYNLYLA